MTKQFWLNLPVKDIQKSKTFFEALGFSFNSKMGNTDFSACMTIGEKSVVVMLFTESHFSGFTRHELVDTTKAVEILLSIDAESKDDVHVIAQKVVDAGGTIFSEPGGNEWMYGCGFADLDGHRWNVLFMKM